MGIYLDHNATTPVHPTVVAAMAEALSGIFGNPSSTHAEGARARRALDDARQAVAALVGAQPGELIFTGSATEANNAAIHGALATSPRGRHVVTTTIEHPSVDEPLRSLEAAGRARVTRVAVDRGGRLDPDDVAAALRDETALVAVILANNETGVLQDVAAIGEAARARGVPVHVDATQAVGKVPVDVAALGARSLAASAHKFNGPKGAAFLVDRSTPSLPAFVEGGPQERRRRGGTENLPGIVGLGCAAALAAAEIDDRASHVRALRDRLWRGIEAALPGVERNGAAAHLLPNTLNVHFPEVAGEILVEALDGEGIAVSAGAACHSGSVEPSHVLLAMGRTAAEARGSLRLSVGPSNTADEIERVLAVLPSLVARVREVAA